MYPQPKCTFSLKCNLIDVAQELHQLSQKFLVPSLHELSLHGLLGARADAHLDEKTAMRLSPLHYVSMWRARGPTSSLEPLQLILHSVLTADREAQAVVVVVYSSSSSSR